MTTTGPVKPTTEPAKPTTRPAQHAIPVRDNPAWYSNDRSKLSTQLDGWLAEVANSSKGKNFPIPSARVIIAPHAGYEYSGPTAAWAYQALDLSNVKHVFLLGPAHFDNLPGCALSTHSRYATPLGDLRLDLGIIKALRSIKKEPDASDTPTSPKALSVLNTSNASSDSNASNASKRLKSSKPDVPFIEWDTVTELKEHSLEMHLPYIYKMLSRHFKSEEDFPTLIPILVGETKPDYERYYGEILAPYLADPTSIFIASSDFCHWGLHFNYTPYLPDAGSPVNLREGQANPTKPPIYKSIERLDRLAMDAIEGGKHQDFVDYIQKTHNNVCGKHPIGVIMAALEVLHEEGKISNQESGRFRFIYNTRSKNVRDIRDSSVSYASAVAVV